MILSKIIFIAVICLILSIIVSKINPEFKLYFSLLFGIVATFLIFGEVKDSIVDIISKFSSYNISMENFSILIKIVLIAYICDFASLVCKDLKYESIGSKIEVCGKVIILIYSFNVITQFIDEVFILVNRWLMWNCIKL